MSERISPQGGSSTAPQPIFATANLRGWTEDQIRAVVRDEMQLAEIRRLRRELDESRADAAVLSAVTDPALRPLPELSVWDEAIAEARAPLLAEIDRLTADNAALRTGFEQQTASIGEQVNRAVQAERAALLAELYRQKAAREPEVGGSWRNGYQSALECVRYWAMARIEAEPTCKDSLQVQPDHDVARAESEGMVQREPTGKESLPVQSEADWPGPRPWEPLSDVELTDMIHVTEPDSPSMDFTADQVYRLAREVEQHRQAEKPRLVDSYPTNAVEAEREACAIAAFRFVAKDCPGCGYCFQCPTCSRAKEIAAMIRGRGETAPK